MGYLVVAVLLAVGVVHLGLWGWWRWEVRAIAKSGAPVTFEALRDQSQERVSGANAAEYYERAFALLAEADEAADFEESERVDEWLKTERPLGAEDVTEMQRWLSKREEAIGLLYEGAETGACEYTLDLPATEVPIEVSVGIRAAVKALCVAARAHAALGQGEETERALVAAMRVAKTMRWLPNLINTLVLTADEKRISQTLGHLLTDGALTGEQALQLADEFSWTPDADTLRRTFIGERCFGLAYESDMSLWEEIEFRWGSPVDLVLYPLWNWTGLTYWGSVQWMEYWERAIAMADLPYPERINELAQFGNEIETAPAWMRYVVEPLYMMCMFYKADADREARARATLSGLLVYEHWQRTGAMPESLEAIVLVEHAEWAIDPYSGDSLLLRAEDGGFTVYSVGNDGAYDEGKELTGVRPCDCDVAFRVGRTDNGEAP